jgi:hypothetical protein
MGKTKTKKTKVRTTRARKTRTRKNKTKGEFELSDYLNAIKILFLAFIGITCGILFTTLFVVLMSP